jgi:hypothetical protein
VGVSEAVVEAKGLGVGTTPHTAYQDRLERHEAARDLAAGRSLRLSNTRVATFLAGFAALVAADMLPQPLAAIAVGLLVVLVAAFIAQVVLHRRARRDERWHDALASVAREGLLRIGRDWDALRSTLPAAERDHAEPERDHPYARDLDVLGTASLIHLAGPVASERGRQVLRSWLLAPAAPDEVRERQGAVRELAPAAELRAEVTALGRMVAADASHGIEHLIGWAEREPWILDQRSLRAASWVLPPLVLAGVAAQIVLGAPALWLLPAVPQLIAYRRIGRWAGATFGHAERGGGSLRGLVPQLAALDGLTWEDARLRSLEARLRTGERRAHVHLERLVRLLDTVESRRNVVYAILSPLLLLDAHLGVALDRWRVANGRAVRDWIDAAGEWEALAALATLAHDHPTWSYPTFLDGPEAAPTAASRTTFTARALGHPLLHPDRCVRNDVAIGPAGTFLFVTGSNMSGKSTLLRAVGANAVLAGAGAPVCCEALILPSVRVHTCMRVQDSLAEGVSLFMAELLRIKEIVEAVDAQDPRPVLYLLDEILHGTNAVERRVAARGVLRHLLASPAIGAVSSHDLELADHPDLHAAAHAVHFTERVEADPEHGTRLSFDYRLRDGIATTRNALELLRAVGLGELASGD